MERERSGKVIAIATLIVGIIGLSLGFAAFSTSLNITSSADVQIDSNVWKVGFSDVSTSIHANTINGQTNSTNNGTLTLTQFVISQGTNAVLSTTAGSKVEYNFYIVNEGDLDAYLNSVTMGNLSCAYQSNPTPSPRTTDDNHTTITAGAGTITPADCNTMFSATLMIDNSNSATFTDGQSSSSGFGTTAQLPRPSGNPKVPTYVPAKLTIEYTGGDMSGVTNVPMGDFTVSLSDSTVVYGSNSN